MDPDLYQIIRIHNTASGVEGLGLLRKDKQLILATVRHACEERYPRNDICKCGRGPVGTASSQLVRDF